MKRTAATRDSAEFDVVIVGASIAGCTAARLFALSGARVALVERRADPAAYKVVCTHAILSSATPTIERLGLAPLLDACGAVRAHADAWTPFSGWVGFPTDTPHGYCITRAKLDPLLRELTAQTSGVDLVTGQTVVALRADAGSPAGVETEDARHRRRTFRGRLVVAADGRDSTVARLARIRARVRPNNRFAYWAYWRGIRPRTTTARIWLLDPDGAAAFPNEDDLMVVAVTAHKDRLAAFRADPEAAYHEAVAALPDGPVLDGAERVSKLLGKLELPNKARPAARPGLALVGDAALASDPLFGVGCGWAFQSAEWLVDNTRSAIAEGGDLDAGLRRYRRVLRARLGIHHWLIADFSTGRRMRAIERLGLSQAARSPQVARAVEEVATRRRSPLRLLDPRLALGYRADAVGA